MIWDPDPDTNPVVPMTLEFPTWTLKDHELIGAMMTAGAFRAVEDVVALALWHYAKHLQIGDIPNEVFGLTLRLRRLGLHAGGGS